MINNADAKVAPCPRAGHSAIIRKTDNDDFMYIFGGKDDENNKLNDIWRFSFTSNTWSEISKGGDDFDGPLPRGGHVAQVFRGDFMIIYGGIYDVCKELNDLHVFDMKNEKWICLFEEQNSPRKVGTSNNESISSPVKKSPTLRKEKTLENTGLKMTVKNTNTTMKKKKIKLMPLSSEKQEEREIKLESPTYVSMKNSFLIKNADPSFEKCYAQIKKRLFDKERTGGSPGLNEKQTKTCGKRPPARDGHTGLIIGASFFIFGGDRHHMPFNDFFMLDLQSEF